MCRSNQDVHAVPDASVAYLYLESLHHDVALLRILKLQQLRVDKQQGRGGAAIRHSIQSS